MPSSVQPVQAAQKPVICPRDSLVRGIPAAVAAGELLVMTFSSSASSAPDRASARPSQDLILVKLFWILYTLSQW